MWAWLKMATRFTKVSDLKISESFILFSIFLVAFLGHARQNFALCHSSKHLTFEEYLKKKSECWDTVNDILATLVGDLAKFHVQWDEVGGF